MRETGRFLFLLTAIIFVFILTASSQDDGTASLGDVARQTRQQKQQKDAQASKDASANPAAPAASKDAPSKDASSKEGENKTASAENGAGKNAQPAKTAKKVVTNEDLPEHVGPTRTRPAVQRTAEAYDSEPNEEDQKIPAEYWTMRIQALKHQIAILKSEISETTASLQNGPGTCVSNCVEWNERQQQKQQQVDAMNMQLQEMEKALEEMQDMARKQGYGSSVYDP